MVDLKEMKTFRTYKMVFILLRDQEIIVYYSKKRKIILAKNGK